MTIIQAIILGIVQGLTEFLPISSSGHLVIVPAVFNWEIPHDQAFMFDVLVQLGTLVAVIIYFRNDLWKIIKGVLEGLVKRDPWGNSDSRLGWKLAFATIPAVLVGLLLKDTVEAAFESTTFTGIFLLLTAAVLIVGDRFGKQNRNSDDLSIWETIWVGLFQALALFPGVSRSGSTITGGMTRGLKRAEAARFSFLMAVPVMIGAGGLAILDLLDMPNLTEFIGPLVIGFVVSGIVGYIAIHWLLRFLSTNRLTPFVVYLVVLGLFTIIFV